MQFMKSQRGELPPSDTASAGSTREQATCGLLVAVIVTCACLFGVWTRLAGQLAVFWPANALLLGLLLRYPRLDTSAGWVGAAVGYLLAGHLAGDPPAASVLLTLGNFASVVTGYLLLARPGSSARRLRGASGVLQLLAIVALASAASGLAGSIVGPFAFGGAPLESGLSWFVSEIVNYIAILPAALTIPSAAPRLVTRQWRTAAPRLRRLVPLAALVLSLAAALIVGGPGAVAFPVPALLWCGMRYGVFATAVLTLFTTTWTLVAISKGWLDMAVAFETPRMLMSLRLGVTLIAVSPIAVAGAMAANRELLARLRQMADHDPLTGAMNRRAFAEQARRVLREARASRTSVGLLVLDIDRFKSVNDTYGHTVGDLVIVHIANVLRGQLLSGLPLLGRLGGEEFAVLLPGCDRARTAEIAERMRETCASAPVDIGEGRALTATVSIGACVALPAPDRLDGMLEAADGALYDAKNAGRNRVVLSKGAG